MAGHGPGPGEEAVQFQGAGAVATAMRVRKVQMQVGLDAPAAVTDGKDWRQEAEAEFRENRDSAAARRESRGHAEAERIVLQAADGEGAAAPEELRSAEAVAGRVQGQPVGTAQARWEGAEAGPGFGLAWAEEGPALARFRDAEVGELRPGIDHESSPSQTPLVLAPHSGRVM